MELNTLIHIIWDGKEGIEIRRTIDLEELIFLVRCGYIIYTTADGELFHRGNAVSEEDIPPLIKAYLAILS